MYKTMYKVVAVRYDGDGHKIRTSAIVYGGDSEVIYERNKWSTSPQWLLDNGYGISVFTYFDQAQAFANQEDFFRTLEIWEVKCAGEMKKPPYCSIIALLSRRIESESGDYWPEGTKFYEKVKLVKRVHEGEIHV